MIWDAKKEQAIELLSFGNMNYEALADQLDINVLTLRVWRRDPDFALEVRKRALDLLKETVPSVYNILTEKSVKKGDLAAIKMLLEQVDRAETDVLKAAEGQISFTWGRKENQELSPLINIDKELL